MVTPLHSGLALGPATLPISRFGAVDSPVIPLWRASASLTSIASHPCSLAPVLHRLEQTQKEKTLMQWFRCREISVQKREVRLICCTQPVCSYAQATKRKRKTIDGCVSVLLVVEGGVLLMLLHLSSVGVCFPQHVCVNSWKGDVG